ncbi:pirin family protein [Phaeocystidibacter luteus]|uniref:Pirin family protein n=1 Tax=Phaeocystidibacter luteus TaxID=911197 RepID=A0A6N6RLK1_9FLAO|nr:pirin family protein [Phaeocystidibacter luteus]KAB2814447.1 pirin family protein [Phaeocystidibacter luteus]
MEKVIHRSSDRGHANHGWLDTHHTFSFANWYNPNQMHFGVLRVLNDDIVAPEKGFGQHPHADMEIVSIPLRGALTHRDTMGNAQAITTGEVQVMSAGTGLQHSEFNESREEEVNFLQLWIFPEKRGVEPRYEQKKFESENRVNGWQQVVRPREEDGDGLWINQNAYMHLVDLESGKSSDYTVNSSGNGVYFFVIEGEVAIGDEQLNRRDGIGIWDVDSISVSASKDSQILAIEVPMELPNF